MPIYTYRCENCGVQFEQHQRFTDSSLVRCPECKKNTLRKVYMPVSIVFKGSGFYATDNRSPSGAGRHSSSNTEKESDKSENKTEIKPETKAKETTPTEKGNASC